MVIFIVRMGMRMRIGGMDWIQGEKERRRDFKVVGCGEGESRFFQN